MLSNTAGTRMDESWIVMADSDFFMAKLASGWIFWQVCVVIVLTGSIHYYTTTFRWRCNGYHWGTVRLCLPGLYYLRHKIATQIDQIKNNSLADCRPCVWNKNLPVPALAGHPFPVKSLLCSTHKYTLANLVSICCEVEQAFQYKNRIQPNEIFVVGEIGRASCRERVLKWV